MDQALASATIDSPCSSWLLLSLVHRHSEQTDKAALLLIDGPLALALAPLAALGLVDLTPADLPHPGVPATLRVDRFAALTEAGRQIAERLPPMPHAPRSSRIIAAALRTAGAVYSLPRPARHADIARAAISAKIALGHLDDLSYGFISDLGIFLTRRRAHDVARAAGQLLDPSRPRSIGLYTDDIW